VCAEAVARAGGIGTEGLTDVSIVGTLEEAKDIWNRPASDAVEELGRAFLD
jgi:hypothetical protein